MPIIVLSAFFLLSTTSIKVYCIYSVFHFLILFNWSCNYVALLVLARISLLESYIYITERLQNGLSGKVKTVMKSKAVSFPVVTRVPSVLALILAPLQTRFGFTAHVWTFPVLPRKSFGLSACRSVTENSFKTWEQTIPPTPTCQIKRYSVYAHK